MSDAARSPTTVGSYRVIGRIGEGGMGVVYLATAGSGEHVALKMLRPALLGDSESRSRLAREVTSLRRVRSSHVAEVIDADPWGDVPYIVTRYVAGPSLREVVDARGGLTGRPLHTLAAGLAEALAGVHAADVLHRDVKPSNVLLEGGEPVLIDFGLAQLVDDVTLTQVGWLLGTPGYLAPEIVEGSAPAPAADVHAWAATVVFAVRGTGPYGRGPATLERSRSGQPDLTGVPDEFLGILTASLRRDPANRPTARQLVDWLAATPVPTAAATGPAAVSGDSLADWLASAPVEPRRPTGSPTETDPGRPDVGADDPLADWNILGDAASPPRSTPTPEAPVAAMEPPPPLASSADREPTMTAAPAAQPPPLSTPLHTRLVERPGSGSGSGSAQGPETGVEDDAAAPVVGRVRGTVLTVCLLAVSSAVAVAAPVVAAILAVLANWGLRTLAVATEALLRRRERRGPRRRDTTVTALATPWHAGQAFSPTVVALVIVGLCVAPFALLGALGPDPVKTPAFAAAGIVAVLTSASWSLGRHVRDGAQLLALRTPRRPGPLALIVVASLAVTTALLAVQQISGTSSWPL